MSEPRQDALDELLERPVAERVAELVRRVGELDRGEAEVIDGNAARDRVLARLRTLRS